MGWVGWWHGDESCPVQVEWEVVEGVCGDWVGWHGVVPTIASPLPPLPLALPAPPPVTAIVLLAPLVHRTMATPLPTMPSLVPPGSLLQGPKSPPNSNCFGGSTTGRNNKDGGRVFSVDCSPPRGRIIEGGWSIRGCHFGCIWGGRSRGVGRGGMGRAVEGARGRTIGILRTPRRCSCSAVV